jgi:hypothetical protein
MNDGELATSLRINRRFGEHNLSIKQAGST